MPQNDRLLPGKHDDSGKMGDLGEQSGSRFRQLVLPIRRVHFLLQVPHLVGGQRLGVQHGVDEETVALHGGHPSRGDVRRRQETELFQVRHDIANGGGTHGAARVPRQGTRPYRSSLPDVAVNEQLEEVFGPSAQYAAPRRSRRHSLAFPADARHRATHSTARACRSALSPTRIMFSLAVVLLAVDPASPPDALARGAPGDGREECITVPEPV